MKKIKFLDKNCSTTRLVIKEKPTIVKKPEDTFESVLFLPEGKNREGEGGLRREGYFKASYPDKPLISIITVVFNGENYLEETILSVLNQDYYNVEYIIIDGGSTDETINIIRKYEQVIDYWVSESDKGIYDAMNKGILASTGDIIGIVNADDTLYVDTLKNIQVLMTSKNLDYVYGSVHLMDEKGDVVGEMKCMNLEEISLKKYVDMPFPHPSLFICAEVYKNLGLFNLKYRLSADYDFVLRLLEEKYVGAPLEVHTGKFRSGGQSGGIETFVDTKNVLLSYNVSKFSVYKNMITSITKVFLLRYLPSISLKLKRIFRKKSRHVMYEENI